MEVKPQGMQGVASSGSFSQVVSTFLILQVWQLLLYNFILFFSLLLHSGKWLVLTQYPQMQYIFNVFILSSILRIEFNSARNKQLCFECSNKWYAPWFFFFIRQLENICKMGCAVTEQVHNAKWFKWFKS